MTAVATGLLVGAALLLLGLIAAGPIRAVREERRLAAEERSWLEAGQFPAELKRVYGQARLALTDGTRLRELGYELVERRKARGSFGRVLVVVWEAASPPARPAAAGPGGETPPSPEAPAPHPGPPELAQD